MRWWKAAGLFVGTLLLTAADKPERLTRDDYAKAVITHLTEFDTSMIVYGKSDQTSWSVRQAIDSVVPSGACSLRVILGEKSGGTHAPVGSLVLDWTRIAASYDPGMVVLRGGEGPDAVRLELLTTAYPGTEEAIADELRALRLLCADPDAAVPANAVRDLDVILVNDVETTRLQEAMDDDFDPQRDVKAFAVKNFDRDQCLLALIAPDVSILNLRGADVRIDDEEEKVAVVEPGGATKRIGFFSDHRSLIVAMLRAIQRSCTAE